MEKKTTKSGNFSIYHLSDAGNPEAHDTRGGDWFFQPVGYDGGEAYSTGYPTRVYALDAAEDHENHQAIEESARE